MSDTKKMVDVNSTFANPTSANSTSANSTSNPIALHMYTSDAIHVQEFLNDPYFQHFLETEEQYFSNMLRKNLPAQTMFVECCKAFAAFVNESKCVFNWRDVYRYLAERRNAFGASPTTKQTYLVAHALDPSQTKPHLPVVYRTKKLPCATFQFWIVMSTTNEWGKSECKKVGFDIDDEKQVTQNIKNLSRSGFMCFDKISSNKNEGDENNNNNNNNNVSNNKTIHDALRIKLFISDVSHPNI